MVMSVQGFLKFSAAPLVLRKLMNDLNQTHLGMGHNLFYMKNGGEETCKLHLTLHLTFFCCIFCKYSCWNATVEHRRFKGDYDCFSCVLDGKMEWWIRKYKYIKY